uniref:COB1=BACTERIAL sex pheromone n=1 Tax=Enterococcus faecalis TaxID=1351 RepID=Q9R4M3_ENTFL|nr:cOB1=bacterial sex pheromone [Enterococcus faecalis, Peptide, 8 aa] [Enterococcus faecalis]
VAVLVLGA